MAGLSRHCQTAAFGRLFAFVGMVFGNACPVAASTHDAHWALREFFSNPVFSIAGGRDTEAGYP
ncbi:hypothetical protein L2249_20450, partial [Xanthomonas perforans]|uniref:hypothetical protein n=1 Tax=Xanthomonas perforans TaxID=442694 RepID=UPI001F3310D2